MEDNWLLTRFMLPYKPARASNPKLESKLQLIKGTYCRSTILCTSNHKHKYNALAYYLTDVIIFFLVTI
jgi:hypothetical protein